MLELFSEISLTRKDQYPDPTLNNRIADTDQRGHLISDPPDSDPQYWFYIKHCFFLTGVREGHHPCHRQGLPLARRQCDAGVHPW